MSDDKSPAFPELPEAVESALADLLGAQFNLGLAAGKHGPRSIHSRMPVVIAAASAVQSTVDALRAALAAAQPPAAQADSIVEAWLLGRAVHYLVLGGHDDEWTDFSGGGKPNTGSKRLAWRLKPTPQAQSVPAAGAQSWRPIETAPKDGSMFLCWVAAERWSGLDGECSSRAHDTSQVDFCWWRPPFDGSPESDYFDNASGQVGDSQAVTHWMPLPTAPTGSAG